MKSIKFQTIQNLFFYLFIFFLPWQTAWIISEKFIQGEKWQWNTQAIYFFEIILTFWIILTFYNLGCQKYKQIFVYFWQKNLFLKIFTAFIIWISFSFFWSYDKNLTFYYELVAWISWGLLINFLINFSSLSLTKMAWIFILSLTIHSFIAGQQFLLQNSWANKWLGISQHSLNFGGTAKLTLADNQKWLRAYGGFPHPNILGGFLIVSLILLISLFLFLNYSKKIKIIIILLIASQFFILLATFSRSAWLGFLIALLISFILSKYSRIIIPLRSTLAIVLTLLFTLFLFVYIYSPLLLNRLIFQSVSQRQALTERLCYLNQSFFILKNHLILGVGAGNYTTYLYNFLPSKFPLWQYQPVHNIYLLLTAELGLVGLVLFLIFIISSIRNFFILKSKNIYSITIFSILSGWLVVGLFDHWPWTQISAWMLFVILLGIINSSSF